MRIWLMSLLLVCSCVDQIQVKQGAGLSCWWEGYVAFSGSMIIEGDGLDGFQEYLGGDWELVNKRNGLVCRISTEPVETPEAQ